MTALEVIAISLVTLIVFAAIHSTWSPRSPSSSSLSPAVPQPAPSQRSSRNRRKKSSKNGKPAPLGSSTDDTAADDTAADDTAADDTAADDTAADAGTDEAGPSDAVLSKQVATLNQQVATLNTQAATLNTQVETLNTQVARLNKLVADGLVTIAPIYLSLLVKGIASYAFWHGKDLYPYNRQLSVRQLHDLNCKLQMTSGNKLQAAKHIVRQYPDGKRAYAPGKLEDCYPGIQSCVDRCSIPGNGPDDNRHHITPQTLEKLKDKAYVENRNERAHEASAATLANFLRSIEMFEDFEKPGYLIDDFTTYVFWFRILFGFDFKDIASQSKSDQTQILTNSGSLETMAGSEDEDEESNFKQREPDMDEQ
ncbi:hypothetical protein C8R45DRAFT_1216893 [Mycena sanguinolenta]|nr:hypothetical protein C8R45DRAFT_1216893 [Mycena sanguinolenta]